MSTLPESGLRVFTSTDRNLRAALNPLAVYTAAWANRSLIRRLAARQLAARYRGSLLGALWTVLMPLLMLALYSFVFGVVMPGRGQASGAAKGNFALILFAGLIVYNLFAEIATRSPSLMLDNKTYITRLVFPLETLVWASLGAAIVNALVSLVVLIAFYLIFLGAPPVTALLAPIVFVPLILTALSLSWVLASLGVFIRDIGLILGVVMSAFLFFSTIFFPLSAVPNLAKPFILANPVTPAVENLRAVLFAGQWPDPWLWGGSLVAALVFNWLGFCWFQATRKAFADVC